jgi:hypothetical protein
LTKNWWENKKKQEKNLLFTYIISIFAPDKSIPAFAGSLIFHRLRLVASCTNLFSMKKARLEDSLTFYR